jgi:TolA-binding protein
MKLVRGIIAVTVIATAFSMVPLRDHPAVADQSAPQQQPIADVLQDFITDHLAVDQRLRTLEQRLQTLEQQIQTLLDTRERAVQTHTETSPQPKSWVTPKQTATKYRRRRHEAGETVDANPAARQEVTFGCPASVPSPCVKQGAAPLTAPTATREYDEAGAEVK